MFNSEKINLLKLKVGNSFSLFKDKWKITEIGEYDWRMDNTSIEYTITNDTKTAYLEVELFRESYEIVYSEAIHIDLQTITNAIINKQLKFENKLFILEETCQGDYKNLTTHSTREKLECFIFYSKNDSQITIEKWDDNTYEVFIGEEIKPKKIKNIIS